jgi:tyrosinase
MYLAMRQDQSTLDPPLKQQFVNAVLDLKANGKYDQYVQWHKDTLKRDPNTGEFIADDAHAGPAFFAWHRQFLRSFEEDLQGTPSWVYKNMGLPYWDWTVDNSPSSSIWLDNFMGPNGDQTLPDPHVMSGPFSIHTRPDGDPRKWTLNVRTDIEQFPYLRRMFKTYVSSLPTQKDVQDTLNATPYDVDPWNDISGSGFRSNAEGFAQAAGPAMHNRVHVWVGGSMTTMTSPNDPVFWLHHCFMDKLWADWERMHKTDASSSYLPPFGARPGHNLNDSMSPWSVKPSSVLFHREHGYRYDTENYLNPGEELYPNQYMLSTDRSTVLLLNGDGRLVLYRRIDGHWIWPSPDVHKPGCRCMMRGDGNLVIYQPPANPYDPPIWQSGTNIPGSKLTVGPGFVGLSPPGESSMYWFQPRGSA